jgi:hypothetical protein
LATVSAEHRLPDSCVAGQQITGSISPPGTSRHGKSA